MKLCLFWNIGGAPTWQKKVTAFSLIPVNGLKALKCVKKHIGNSFGKHLKVILVKFCILTNDVSLTKPNSPKLCWDEEWHFQPTEMFRLTWDEEQKEETSEHHDCDLVLYGVWKRLSRCNHHPSCYWNRDGQLLWPALCFCDFVTPRNCDHPPQAVGCVLN